RRDDGHDESQDIEFEDVPGAQQTGNHPADDGPGKSQQQGDEQAQVLLAGLDKTCKCANDESRDDESDHVSGLFSRLWVQRGGGFTTFDPRACLSCARSTMWRKPMGHSPRGVAPSVGVATPWTRGANGARHSGYPVVRSQAINGEA